MLKETLDKLDEKFLTNPRSKMSYLNGDEKRELVKFVEEEIKLAVEEIVKSRNAENTYSVNTFEAGYKAKEFEIQWNLNKYFEV